MSKKKTPPPETEAQPPADGLPAVRCAFTEMRAVADLREHPQNPNKHGAEQLRLLAKVIGATGWRSPVVVSKRSGYVVKGHGRLQAARLAGWASVPVDVQEYADEAMELADLVADNRLAELADMDAAALKDLLGAMDTGAVDMELAGFTEMELARIMSQFHVQGENDARAEWEGMPEFEQEDMLAKKSVKMNFLSEESFAEFCALIGQKLTMKTRSAWFPYQPPEKLAALRFSHEP